MIAAGKPPATQSYFDRVDLVLLLALTAVAFVLRFFSPILPDFFLHPFQAPFVTNCVSPTPIDAQGDVGTLCGLDYPFNRGYPAANGQLSPPNGQVFDEIYFPVDALNDVKGMEVCRPATVGCFYNYFDPEPPLAKELVGAGEWGYGWFLATFQGAKGDYIDLGFNTFGWRIAACLFGTLCIPMMYLLARRMWSNRLFAIAAATLVCFDGMFFIQSRIGMIDIFPIFFILSAYFLFFVHMQSRTFNASMLTLLALGTVLGIGIAAKWIVLAAWASIVFFLLLRLVLRAFNVQWGPPTTPGIPFPAYLAVGVIALVAVPLVIYVLSWYPFFARGQFQNLLDLWNYQVESYRYHAGLIATHPYGSPAWSWPFLARPVLYYAEYHPYLGLDQFTGQELEARMINLGNPWIWWTSLPCIAAMPYFIVRHRSFLAAVILLGFITQYAPWFPISRVLFMYHMFGGLIFMVLALAFVLAHVAEKFRPPGREMLVAAHLATAVLFFGYFYPVWTALPISVSAYAESDGTPPWGPKLWLVNCKTNPPPSQPQLFCWN
ncbi:MAG: phospholipid carrier-dependent glycosyltransferase [Chloroflexi bacterium]|nr:MAG: phospholipid carrier-dependent glycosyltransferase [Chloroflexota bacterium]